MLTNTEDNNNKIFIYSLLIVITGELLINFIKFNNVQAGSLLKLFVHSHIYISIIFLLLSYRLSNLENFNSKFLKVILIILIFYSVFQIFRFSPIDTNLYVKNPIYARFGNIWYGPMFLVPFFILWGLNKDSIYWFEVISINAVKLGIFLFLLSLIFDFKVPYVLFLSSFCLLAGFSYSNPERKFWIVIGLAVSIIVFYNESYRTGILRIILATLCFYISTTNFSFIKKFLIIFFVFSPIFIALDVLYNDPNIFQSLSQLSSQDNANLFIDTRTFLFKETFSQLQNRNNLLLGLGSMGNYYSQYFYDLLLFFPDFEADFYIRSKVEVGFLQMLLKGGILYILLIATIYGILISKIKIIKNSYINNLTYLSLSNFFLMSVENVPAFNYLNSLIWIMVGICLCYLNQIKNDDEIKSIFQNKG